MKQCSKCLKSKTINNFYKRNYKNGHTSLYPWCNKCFSEWASTYRKANMQKFCDNAKKWVKSNPLAHKLILFRRQSKIKDPMLTTENVIKKFGNKPCCYLSGVPINLTKPDTYELDHIIPVTCGGDSSLSNCGLTSRIANRAKNNFSKEDFITLCRQVSDFNMDV